MRSGNALRQSIMGETQNRFENRLPVPACGVQPWRYWVFRTSSWQHKTTSDRFELLAPSALAVRVMERGSASGFLVVWLA